MGTNTGIGIGIGIPFKNNALDGDRPYLPPELKARLIGVWDNYGKKNTDADRNIIKNKIPNAGGDLEILNAAYKLNSGFGEYKEDFTSWRIYPNIEVTDNVITTNGNFNSSWFIYKHANENEINEMNIKVSGIPEEGIIRYIYIPDETATIPVSYNISEDGVYHLPKSKLSSNRVSVGFTVSSSYDWNNIRIEQLSDFGGAFVTDGVNDIIISQKTLQEMGVTKDFTIVSMIHQISWRGSGSVPLTNYIRPTDNIYVRNQVADIGKTGIYGYVVYDIKNSTVGNSHIVNTILGDKNDYSIYTIGDLSQGKFSVQGYIDGNSNIRETSSVAHYWTFALLGKATEDDINLIIAYFNLDRTLKPDILCNTIKQGITNENHAEFGDKLIDYSGNGRDIQLNNLAWKGGSGIAAKPFETIKDYTIVPDEARQKLTIYNEFSYKIKSNTPSYYWTVQSIIRDNTSYQVTIITDKDCYWINATSFINNEGNRESIRKEYPVKANTPTQVTICGLNEFEYPEGIEPTAAVSYVNLSYAGEVTVTFIPSCKGGLLLDGVNDFGQFVGDFGLKDYTFIADRAYDRIVLEQAPFIASKSTNGQAPFLMEYLNSDNYVYPHSFGATTKTTNLNIQRQISYQSTYVYNGNSISKGTSVDTGDGLTIGNSGSTGAQYSPLCLWSLMLFPYSMSEFLIERQLKKHKLGTLYPNMVEFRPIIKSSVELATKPTFVIRGTSTLLNAGDYIPENSEICVVITMNNAADRITKFVINGNTIDIPSSAYNPSTMKYGFPFTIDSKSPQKINLTIEQDENYVQWNPVVTSNVEYNKLDFYLNNYQKRINIGDYIPKDAYLRANLYLKNNVDELTAFIFNGVNIGYRRSSVDDTAFNINQIYNYDSPQEVNITIDEYIRFEDIVQPYPVLLRFNDENGNEVSWGGKFRVGSTITSIGSIADPESNLLNGLYSVSGLSLNGKAVTSSTNIVEKQMAFRTTATWLLDNNEPKVILSPSRLRIPNSSYKILGYIPDISGHGNHGKINNSAYAEGSGVNADGSYQFDGVDDFVTIPTTVGGKQVLMKVNWQKSPTLLYDQRGYNNEFAIYNGSVDNDGNPIPVYNGRNNGQTYIDGILNSNIKASELRAITHNITITNELSAGVNKFSPVIGSNRVHNAYFTNMSLYDFMLFDEISTEDKIKELNEYVGIEAKVELPPYYWDAYGKTNFDADRDTIQQRGIAVGDYDLINYNHAYEGMSGYNGYPIILSGTNRTYRNKASYVNVVGDDKNVINLTRISFNTAAIFSYVKQNGELTSYNKDIESFKIKVTGIDYSRFVIKYSYISEANATTKTTMTIASDSIYELPKSFASDGSLTSSDIWIGINFTKQSDDMPDIIEDVNVTIEVLPEYENGLVYDGVEDFSDNKNVPIIYDFTVIAKRTWLEENISDKPFIIKGDTLYPDGNQNAFLFEYGKLSTYSFGQNNKYDESVVPSLISWATPTSYNGTTSLVRGSAIDTVGIDIAHATKMVLYKLILYPKTISLLEINFLKNLMEKDEIIDLNNPIFIKNE